MLRTVAVGRHERRPHSRAGEPLADALARVLPDPRRRTLPDQDHAVAAAVLAPVLREFCIS